MTQPIQEPSTDRALQGLAFARDQIFRRPGQSGVHYPICFRAAMGSIADPEGDRVHYPSGDGGDAVYWDQWDPTFDATIYDIDAYEVTVNGIDCIAGVGLLALGVYSIHAQIDLNDVFNGVIQLNSNFDEGQATYSEHNNVAPGADYLSDFYLPRVDHWRTVDELPPPDQLWGGEATDVQIVFSQNCDATITYYGIDPGVGDPPVAGEEVWIPGGYDGAWGYVPNMIVKYWGPTGLDPDWPSSFQIT